MWNNEPKEIKFNSCSYLLIDYCSEGINTLNTRIDKSNHCAIGITGMSLDYNEDSK